MPLSSLCQIVEPGLLILEGGLEKGNNVVVEESVGVTSGEIRWTRHEFLGYFLLQKVSHALLSGLVRYMFDFIAVLPHVVC